MLRAAWSRVPHSTLKHNILRDGSDDGNHLLPIDDPVATGAADRRPHHFAAFGIRLFDRDVFGVDVNQAVFDPLQPRDRVLAPEVRIARIEIGADERRIDQVQDAVVLGGDQGIGLVHLQAELDAARAQTLEASMIEYRISTKSSSSVVHGCLCPSCVLMTGAPHSAA